MRKTVKIICIALCAVILVGLGLYFIPWSTHVDQKMYAAVISEDDEILYESEIKLSGSKKDYLFKKDTYDGTITFITEQTDKNRRYQDLSLAKPFHDTPEENPYIFGTYNVYNGGLNSYMHGSYNLSFDQNVLILTDFGPEGKYLVASTDPDFDPLATLNAYKQSPGIK